MTATLATTAHCTTCAREVRISEQYAFGGRDKLRASLTCGHVVSREEIITAHAVTVAWEPNNHGFPYRATCACGWTSLSYANRIAPQIMADEHIG